MQTVTKIKSPSLRKLSLITIALVGGGIFITAGRREPRNSAR